MGYSPQQLEQLADAALTAARRHGADAADCVIGANDMVSVSALNGKVENVERDESTVLGLRVFAGQSQAIVSTSDLKESGFEALAEQAMAMARLAPSDDLAGLADKQQLSSDMPLLDLDDGEDIAADRLGRLAVECETAGLGVAGVSKSNGAGANAGRRHITLATSTGFCNSYSRSSYSLSASLVAGEGTAMERDYDFSTAVRFTDLEDAETIGISAGERSVKRLNPRKIASQTLAVIFDKRVASGLLMHLTNAINGQAVARGSSFLKDRLGEQVFAAGINIIDDATLAAQPGSKPFDGEGVGVKPVRIVDAGVLTSWLLDCRSARQLGLTSTGHAARGASSPPQPAASNVYLEAGTATPEELMAQAGTGLWVTELIGMGVNAVTGDYSRGASGFWFENGEIAYPVSEITIAGNLNDMYRQLVPANDLEMRGRVNAPSCGLGEMTVAGT